MLLYVFCINKDIISTIRKAITLKTCFVTNYEVPVLNGVVTENILNKITSSDVISISKDNIASETIFGCIVKPDYNNIVINYDTFIALNFFDKHYVKQVLDLENYYDIFNYVKLGNLRTKFNNIIQNITRDEQLKILNIEHNINRITSAVLPFKYTIINYDEVNEFVDNYNVNIDNITWIDKTNLHTNVDTSVDTSVDTNKKSSNNINYILSEIRFGLGDFIQRYNKHLLPFINHSSDNYILHIDEKYSYTNSSHHGVKYFSMYNFPAFNFGIKKDDLNDNYISYIGYTNFAELIVYNKSFFSDFNIDYFLCIDLGLCPAQGCSKNNNYNYCSSQIKQDILTTKIPHLRFNDTNNYFNFSKFSNNDIVILHFRRGDYVDMLLQNRGTSRTMNTFNHLITNLCEKLQTLQINSVDAIIMSDHYEYNNLNIINKKYIPILFDYNQIDVGTVVEKHNIKIHIKDKVLGNSKETEYSVLKYLANCKYIIGNQSCFPNIISEALGNNIINLSRNIIPDIRYIDDLEYLLHNPDNNTPSLLKYSL